VSGLYDALLTGRTKPLWHPALRDSLEFALAELCRRTQSYDVAEHRILAVVARQEGLSQQALADRTALDRTTTSKAVRRLEERQQLWRRPDDLDPRKLLLLASPETQRAAARSAERALYEEQKALSRLTISERERLKELLTKAL